MKTNSLIVLGLAFASFSIQETDQYQDIDLPNILWLTSEDNSAFLGCYGDKFATTPNLDKLASEGFLYTHAYANAPVCSPARNTIITGVYANSGGNQHMRSTYPKSDQVKFFPQFLREIGYYCTNNVKQDYNIDANQIVNIWDESSRTAHYKNREPGQPFFAVFNTTISHESSIHEVKPVEQLRHDPKKVPVPPYHPRTPEIEHDWAHYYDKVEDMDTWVGEQLRELEEAGLADNTIVFYYADHGGVLARSKRFVYETGTHVPFIIRIPEKYKHLFPKESTGTEVNRLISFVDLAPTILSIAGIPIPEYMQGSAFLGNWKTEDPEYAYMFRDRMDERYDLSRAVRDQKYRYIRNYMPHLIYGQYLAYLWRAPSVGSWEDAYKNGQCNEIQGAFWKPKPVEELYDTENDPWEVYNLANDPEYQEIIKRMRKANRDWILKIKDTGFIPEPDRSVRMGNISSYDYMREGDVNLTGIFKAAEIASNCDPENLHVLMEFLNSDDSSVRYWGAIGLLILKENAAPAVESLKKTLTDPYPSVAIVSAEALYRLNNKEIAEQALLEKLNKDDFACTFALNSIDRLNINTKKIQEKVEKISNVSEQRFNLNISELLLKKWSQ